MDAAPRTATAPRSSRRVEREPATARSEMFAGGGLDDAWAATIRELRGFIARRVEDPDTAEDITQDILVRIHLARDDPTEINSVSAWLHRIARNAIIDHYRTRRSHQRLPDNDDHLNDNEPSADGSAPNRATQELARCLRPLVEQLPDKYRDAVTMVDLEGQTQVAAAQTLGLSTSGMKSRVQRGRRQLRQFITACCSVSIGPTGAVNDYTPRPDGVCISCEGDSAHDDHASPSTAAESRC